MRSGIPFRNQAKAKQYRGEIGVESLFYMLFDNFVDPLSYLKHSIGTFSTGIKGYICSKHIFYGSYYLVVGGHRFGKLHSLDVLKSLVKYDEPY